jgi:LmbE family N-acetylglucosaminyl deacetylase
VHPGEQALDGHMRRAGAHLGIREWMTHKFPNVKFNTVPHLELVQAIEQAIVKFRPETIYTHHASDVNDDHKATCHATVAALRLPERGRPASKDLAVVKRVLAYEVPSSTDWSLASGATFRPTVFVDATATFDAKMAAVREYQGVLRPFPHPCSEEGLRSLAQVRGMASACRLAEAFELLREVC